MAEKASKRELEQLLMRRGLGATLAGGNSCAGESGSDGEVRLASGTITEFVPVDGGGGVTSLGLHLAAGCEGKVAWIDPANRLDPAGAARAGVALRRWLWVRGGDAERALRGAQLVVQAGGFALVVLDLLDQGERELRLPRSAWFRLLRGLERERRTALAVLAPRPLAGSCADRVLAVRHDGQRWNEMAEPVLEGVRIAARVSAARRGEAKPPGSVRALRREFVA